MWLYTVVIFNQFIYGEFFVVVFNVTYQFTLVFFKPNFVKFPQKYIELRGGCIFQVLIGDIIFSKMLLRGQPRCHDLGHGTVVSLYRSCVKSVCVEGIAFAPIIVSCCLPVAVTVGTVRSPHIPPELELIGRPLTFFSGTSIALSPVPLLAFFGTKCHWHIR